MLNKDKQLLVSCYTTSTPSHYLRPPRIEQHHLRRHGKKFPAQLLQGCIVDSTAKSGVQRMVFESTAKEMIIPERK